MKNLLQFAGLLGLAAATAQTDTDIMDAQELWNQYNLSGEPILYLDDFERMYNENAPPEVQSNPDLSALSLYGYDEHHVMSFAEFETVYQQIAGYLEPAAAPVVPDVGTGAGRPYPLIELDLNEAFPGVDPETITIIEIPDAVLLYEGEMPVIAQVAAHIEDCDENIIIEVPVADYCWELGPEFCTCDDGDEYCTCDDGDQYCTCQELDNCTCLQDINYCTCWELDNCTCEEDITVCTCDDGDQFCTCQ